MARFRRKATEIEARQFTGEMFGPINFSVPQVEGGASSLDGKHWIQTPSGPVVIEQGDWIAQNPKDATDFYPIKAAQFANLYEPVGEPVGA